MSSWQMTHNHFYHSESTFEISVNTNCTPDLTPRLMLTLTSIYGFCHWAHLDNLLIFISWCQSRFSEGRWKRFGGSSNRSRWTSPPDGPRGQENPEAELWRRFPSWQVAQNSLPPGDVSWPQRGGKVPIIAGGGAKSLARWQEGAPEGKNHLHRQEIICLRISRWNIAIAWICDHRWNFSPTVGSHLLPDPLTTGNMSLPPNTRHRCVANDVALNSQHQSNNAALLVAQGPNITTTIAASICSKLYYTLSRADVRKQAGERIHALIGGFGSPT